MAAVADSEMQALEFELGGKQYCVELSHVDEIVNNEDSITSVPNTEPEVIGVMDLRGQTATIVDPRLSLDLSASTEPKYVIVFESEDRPIGWLIDDVTQVTTIAESDLDETVANGPVRGVFKRDDEFTVWIDPGVINE